MGRLKSDYLTRAASRRACGILPRPEFLSLGERRSPFPSWGDSFPRLSWLGRKPLPAPGIPFLLWQKLENSDGGGIVRSINRFLPRPPFALCEWLGSRKRAVPSAEMAELVYAQS